MPLQFTDVRWVIVMALWRIAPSAGATPAAPGAGSATPPVIKKWKELKPMAMSKTFAEFANPTGWDSFFSEAFATALQQEIISRGSYVPELVTTVTDFSDADSSETWGQLEDHINARARVLSFT